MNTRKSTLRTSQLSLRGLFGLVAVFGFVCLMIPYCITGYHDHYTCALCRLYRVDYVYESHRWGSSFTETACTQWYRDNVESEHAHVWVHGRASAYRNLYGQRIGAIDFDPPGRVIWSITPEDQIAIYKHLHTLHEGKELFLGLASPNMLINGQDYAILRALEAWKKNGYDGTWKDATEDPN